jgi:hypothetical protein
MGKGGFITMKEKIKKLQIKGYVAGVLTCLFLFSAVGFVYAQTVNRNITYGVGVILNGQQVHFRHDERPFVMDGRTFLPLRTLAELLDLPVDFDPASNNVVVGRATPTRAGTNVTELFFDSNISGASRASSNRVEHRDEVQMGGNRFNNIIVFYSSTGGWRSEVTSTALLNLNGRYSWVNGNFGRIDGTDSGIGAYVRIYVDDRLTESFYQSAQALPRDVRVFTEGARLVRIVVVYDMDFHRTTAYAFSGFAE